MQERQISHRYRDPLSEIWISAAHKIGLRVERSADAFAHSNGQGALFIATDEHLDADDCLAQMIFHELCHSLIEGPESFERQDWGLDNSSRADDEHEHATLRLQALLSGRHGLRRVLGPTTDFRHYYDALPPDPLTPRSDSSSHMAMLGARRAATNPWWPHLGKALEATSQIAALAAAWPAPSSAPSLYRLLEPGLAAHPSGLPGRDNRADERCGQCAWNRAGTCMQADVQTAPETPACERYEVPFDCQDCGACCRAAYHSVTIGEGDPVAERHPQLVVHRESYSEIRREGDHCAALHSEQGRHACTIYEDRPSCCREFENAGQNCVIARRRLGLSL